MTALAIGMTYREAPTTHDYKPGRYQLKGQNKPQKLIDARLAVTQAWNDYDMMIDLRDLHLAVDAEVEHAREKALKAEKHERDLYIEWQDSFHASNLAQVGAE